MCGYAEPCLARPGTNQQGTDKLYPFAIHNHPNFRYGLPQETCGNQERIRRIGMMKGYDWHFAWRFLKPGLCSRIRCEGRKRNGSKDFIEEE